MSAIFIVLEDAEAVKRAAEKLINEATRLGLVLTIEQEPLLPLAMGHYATVVSVRPKRDPA